MAILSIVAVIRHPTVPSFQELSDNVPWNEYKIEFFIKKTKNRNVIMSVLVYESHLKLDE